MKVIAIVISLACFSHGAQADDLATPTPTPIYRNYLARPGSLRRVEQVDRRRAAEDEAQSRAQARAKEKANRRSNATAQAQAREAARAREQAQRELAAQNRRETLREKTHATSDLMTRMGFSEEEIAAQKAREEPVKPGSKQTATTTSQAEHQQQEPKSAADSGVNPPTRANTRSNGAATPQPTSASPGPDAGAR